MNVPIKRAYLEDHSSVLQYFGIKSFQFTILCIYTVTLIHCKILLHEILYRVHISPLSKNGMTDHHRQFMVIDDKAEPEKPKTVVTNKQK
uniref:Uncharacterized protein n=1 Tax=Pyxicephalus adspersus TaxID=30357 RepID=A0AAV3B7I5_PYXAD|nr:TPA: hypothetical protein GDO54_001957 [Pyxicephalus adspersus]